MPGDGRGLPLLRLLGHRHPALRRLLLQVPGHHGHRAGRAGLGWRPLALFTAVLTMYYLFKVFSAGLPGRGQASGPRGRTQSMVFVVAAAGRPLAWLAGLFVA
ncbi:MAG: hypothetical protein MZU95_12975 [Desulfomicrobium escambiense]|nr:hypothetical protein [Desulfomicrobium escambiense]